MKIVRLTTFLDFGGIETRLSTIAHVKDDNEWIFCAINKGGSAESKIRNQNKRVYVFNLPYKIPSIITIYRLRVFFKKEKPDVVHTSGAEANFHGVLAARLAHIPVIIAEEVGIPSQNKITKVIFGLVYRFSDYVVGNSDKVIDYLKNKNNVSFKKLVKIYNPLLFPSLDNPTKK